MKLTNTVTNITKNNKGFSLLEVLVGVSIIGIISAIAVPTYQNYTKKASQTAADTTLSNIAKSFNACTVLNQFSACDTYGEIGISCADCTTPETDSAAGRFCGAIKKDAAGKEFRGCVEIEGTSVKKTYGGMLDKICYRTFTGCTGADSGKNGKAALAPLKRCETTANCGSVPTCTNGAATFQCEIDTGTSAGTCNGSAVCQ